MLYDTDSEYDIERFRQLLNEELEYPERFSDREWDAALTYDYEGTVDPGYLAALGIDNEGFYAFWGYIYPFEEEDASPVALLPFISTGEIAEVLRSGIEDGILVEDEDSDEVFIHVRLTRRSAVRIKDKDGYPSEEFDCIFEITHIYDDDLWD